MSLTEKRRHENLSGGFLYFSALVLPVFIISLVSGCGTLSLQSEQTIYESRYSDVDLTCTALKEAIEGHGLVCQKIKNVNSSMKKHGIQHDRQVRIVEFCQAEYAHKMLQEDPELCTLMPCTFGVFEDRSGRVLISVRNQRGMNNYFNRGLKRAVGETITKHQQIILKEVCCKPVGASAG